jgi:hypothetical protein
MGLFANYSLVKAQLIIAGKRYGIHHFFVPIRDLETNHLLNGVIAGDIGP